MVSGATDELKRLGYTQEQIDKLPEKAVVLPARGPQATGAPRITNVTRAQIPEDFRVRQKASDMFEVRRIEERPSTRLTERETEFVLPGRKVIPGIGPQETFKFDPQTGQIVGRTRLIRAEPKKEVPTVAPEIPPKKDLSFVPSEKEVQFGRKIESPVLSPKQAEAVKHLEQIRAKGRVEFERESAELKEKVEAFRARHPEREISLEVYQSEYLPLIEEIKEYKQEHSKSIEAYTALRGRPIFIGEAKGLAFLGSGAVTSATPVEVIDIERTELQRKAFEEFIGGTLTPEKQEFYRRKLQVGERALVEKPFAGVPEIGLKALTYEVVPGLILGGAGKAFTVGGISALTTYSLRLGGGFVAGTATTQFSPPVLKTIFPDISEEKLLISSQALGVAGFIVGSKATGFAIKKTAPIVEAKFLEKFGLTIFPARVKGELLGTFTTDVKTGEELGFFDIKGTVTKGVAGKGLPASFARAIYKTAPMRFEKPFTVRVSAPIPRQDVIPFGSEFTDIVTPTETLSLVTTTKPFTGESFFVSFKGFAFEQFPTPFVTPARGAQLDPFLTFEQIRGEFIGEKGLEFFQVGKLEETAITSKIITTPAPVETIAPEFGSVLAELKGKKIVSDLARFFDVPKTVVERQLAETAFLRGTLREPGFVGFFRPIDTRFTQQPVSSIQLDIAKITPSETTIPRVTAHEAAHVIDVLTGRLDVGGKITPALRRAAERRAEAFEDIAGFTPERFTFETEPKALTFVETTTPARIEGAIISEKLDAKGIFDYKGFIGQDLKAQVIGERGIEFIFTGKLGGFFIPTATPRRIIEIDLKAEGIKIQPLDLKKATKLAEKEGIKLAAEDFTEAAAGDGLKTIQKFMGKQVLAEKVAFELPRLGARVTGAAVEKAITTTKTKTVPSFGLIAPISIPKTKTKPIKLSLKAAPSLVSISKEIATPSVTIQLQPQKLITKPVIKLVSGERLISAQKPTQEFKTTTKLASELKLDIGQKLDVGTRLDIGQKLDVGTRLDIGQKLASIQVPAFAQRIATRQKLDVGQKFSFKFPLIQIPTTPPPPFIFLPAFPKSKALRLPHARRPKGFEVFVKTKGKFRKVSKFPLTRLSALGLGALKTETAARTFDIRPAKQFGRRIPKLEKFFKPERFRKPRGKTKLPSTAFVERAKYAIDFPKELEEITYKGLAARRRGFTLTNLFGKKRKKKLKRRKK